MRHLSVILATVLLGGSLAACSTMPGPYNGLGSDPMSMVVAHKNPDYGEFTDHDYKIVNEHVNSCFKDIKQQQSGLLEAMAAGGFVNGAAGAGGEALAFHTEAEIVGAKVASHAIPAVAAGVGILSAAQGAANGAQVKSEAVTSVVGSCANGDLHDPRTAAKIQGVHVYGSFVRTKLRSDRLPPWVVRVGATTVEVSQPPSQQAGTPDTTNPEDH